MGYNMVALPIIIDDLMILWVILPIVIDDYMVILAIIIGDLMIFWDYTTHYHYWGLS